MPSTAKTKKKTAKAQVKELPPFFMGCDLLASNTANGAMVEK